VMHLYNLGIDGGKLVTDTETIGIGVRALVNGYWGFAAVPAWTSDVRCDGAAVVPVAADLVTRLYRCAAGSMHRWQVDVAAADPRAIEIVSFVPRAGSARTWRLVP